MKGIQVRWPRRPWNRASPSNPATRKYSWNGHRISCQHSSCLWYYSKHIRDICQSAAEFCTPMSCLHWGSWPSVYVYLRFWGASTSQVIGARNEWWVRMIMMAKWYSGTLGGLKLPDICLTGEEKPRKKPHPGNLSRPGIEPGPAAWQAGMLPPGPQRWTRGRQFEQLL